MMPHPSKTREERIKALLAWAEDVLEKENPEDENYKDLEAIKTGKMERHPDNVFAPFERVTIALEGRCADLYPYVREKTRRNYVEVVLNALMKKFWKQYDKEDKLRVMVHVMQYQKGYIF